MKVTWTTPRDRIALIPPQEYKEKLASLYAHADKARNGFVTVTIETVRNGKLAKKHRSRKYKTKSLYFAENLTFFVIFEEKDQIKIRTVIIERGRK